MSLIFKKTKKTKTFAQLHKLIFGFPKTGKTTFCANIIHDNKEPLFISTEDGQGILQIYNQRVYNWEGFKNVVKYIINKQEEVKKTFSCIVFDLVSDLDIFCEKYICDKYSVSSLSDLHYGKGTALFSAELRSNIQPLYDIMPCVFITHAKEKEFSYQGEKEKIQAPTLSRRAFDYVNDKVDCTGFIIPATKDKETPYITFKPSKMAVAGTRYPFLLETNFPLNYKDMKSSYKEIDNYFKIKMEEINKNENDIHGQKKV